MNDKQVIFGNFSVILCINIAPDKHIKLKSFTLLQPFGVIKMEGMKKLRPCCPKMERAIDKRPFSMMASSSLSLTSGSFQVWRKPYCMNHSGSGASSSTGTKSCVPHSDPETTLLQMVNDHRNKKSQSPPPPSDKKLIPGGDNIFVKTEPVTGAHSRWCRNIDPNMDPKKLRRIISNRVSAQKSRMKKLQYVSDMERKAKALEAQIAMLNPQVALYKNHQELLEIEQKRLNQRMATYANNSILRDVEIEENKAEVNRLRQLYLTQQQEKIQAQTRMAVWESAGLEEFMNSGQYGENTEEMNRLKLLKLKQLAVQCGEDEAETNEPGPLNLNFVQQQNPGQMLMPGWEAPQKEHMNLNLGGIEQILSLNVSQN